MICKGIVALLLTVLLSGCFYYEAPIVVHGDAYILMNINDNDTPNTEVKIPWVK